MPTVIHVSPHPDDESIAAPCTLLALQDAGWKVINFACSLGRPDVAERRGAELTGAMEVAGFECLVPEEPLALSFHDDRERAAKRLVAMLRSLVAETGATLIVGPHPRDRHHGHTAVARAIRQVIWTHPGLVWWMWSIWADLPRPTLVVDCVKGLERSEDMLSRYEGENRRNDYLAMHRQIREVNVVRGIENVFGFGVPRPACVAGIKHAELLTEVRRVGWRWELGAARVLDPECPIPAQWRRLDDPSIMSTSSSRPLYWPPLLAVYDPVHRPVRRFTDLWWPSPDGVRQGRLSGLRGARRRR